VSDTRPDIRISPDRSAVAIYSLLGNIDDHRWMIIEFVDHVEYWARDEHVGDWTPLVEQRPGTITVELPKPSYRDSEGRLHWGDTVTLDATGRTHAIRVEGIGWMLIHEAKALLAKLAAAVHAEGGEQRG
jgi:hypothetical protein